MASPVHQPDERTFTGIQIMRGEGAVEAKGFWADAWSQVLKRPGAVISLIWIGLVAFLAVFAPFIASGHPIILRHLDEGGRVIDTELPLFATLTATDIILSVGTIAGAIFLLLPLPMRRSERLGIVLIGAMQAALIVIACGWLANYLRDANSPDWAKALHRAVWVEWAAPVIISAVLSILFLAISAVRRIGARLAFVTGVAFVSAGAAWCGWTVPLVDFEAYEEMRGSDQATAVYSLIPWSPAQSRTDLYLRPPGALVGEGPDYDASHPLAQRRFLLGTDNIGHDVLSTMLHACRLSISIGVVSTGIAVFIGVTLGALMGYFGGIVDLLLYRVVEIFMAIPVLFLLIVAAAVLPRDTYVMMAIIGCVTWTGAARFTRAEFLKLRHQDFVQSARAVGLPLPSVLFKHMLPNGVTPVLVEASFAIAAAIIIEATLSYLGLGPDGQPSWGKLLSSTTNQTGGFIWWLAIFPGFAIFLTVLAYNMLGEALRDAIDPKLKKPAN